MQAIITKYIHPTDTKQARVKASCQAGSVTVSWDHALDVDGNHDAACEALRKKLHWLAPHYGPHVSGGMPDGTGNAYVIVNHADEAVRRWTSRGATQSNRKGGKP